jgi:N-acetylglucosamine kinase-like BadF-type ATPase
MKNEEKYLVCCDYGGTKLSLTVLSVSGEKLFENISIAMQYSVYGSDECINIIKSAVSKIPFEKKNITAFSIGVSGLRYEKDKKSFEKKLRKSLNIKNIIAESDAITALEGAFSGGDGALLISGTGSVIYGLSKKKILRAGGWGRILGDEGSGYRIGAESLNKLGVFFDYNITNKYTRFFENEFGITRENLLDKVYKDRFDIASIAEKIILSKSQDAYLFKDILISAADNLALLISDYINISKCSLPLKVALSGSTINKENRLTKLLIETVKKYFRKKVVLVKPQNTPQFGAFLLAKKKFKF